MADQDERRFTIEEVDVTIGEARRGAAKECWQLAYAIEAGAVTSKRSVAEAIAEAFHLVEFIELPPGSLTEDQLLALKPGEKVTTKEGSYQVTWKRVDDWRMFESKGDSPCIAGADYLAARGAVPWVAP